MENFDLGMLIVAVIAAAATFIVGFIGGRVDALKEQIKASPQQWDDALLNVAERIAARIAQAKQEDPTKPLGDS